MAISITCPGCQSVYPVPETLAGKTIRCKKCGEMVAVSAPPPPPWRPARRRPGPSRPSGSPRWWTTTTGDPGPAGPLAARPRRGRRPARSDPRAPQPEKKGSKLPLILGAVLGVLVLGAAASGRSSPPGCSAATPSRPTWSRTPARPGCRGSPTRAAGTTTSRRKTAPRRYGRLRQGRHPEAVAQSQRRPPAAGRRPGRGAHPAAGTDHFDDRRPGQPRADQDDDRPDHPDQVQGAPPCSSRSRTGRGGSRHRERVVRHGAEPDLHQRPRPHMNTPRAARSRPR